MLQPNLFMLLIITLSTIFFVLVLRELAGRGQRLSCRVHCHVPVIYSTGVQMRQGCLLDLSRNNCKLQTEGEDWNTGAKVWIGIGYHNLTGTVMSTNRYHASIDLHRSLDTDEVYGLAFGGAGDLMGLR